MEILTVTHSGYPFSAINDPGYHLSTRTSIHRLLDSNSTTKRSKVSRHSALTTKCTYLSSDIRYAIKDGGFLKNVFQRGSDESP